MDSYMGLIMLFAGNFAPRGWQFCDGRIMQIAANTAMFSILGTTYGGDGRTTFALPNLKPLKNATGAKAPLHYIICMEGIFPSRA